jgi:branched-subunit amino acid transport protein
MCARALEPEIKKKLKRALPFIATKKFLLSSAVQSILYYIFYGG